MTSNELIDLDAVVSPDLRVQLNGVKYRLPGDAPAEIMLAIGVLLGELNDLDEQTGAERMLELREELGEKIEDLFRVRQPDLEVGALMLTDTQILELVTKLSVAYGVVDEAELEDDADPPTTAEKPKTSERSGRRSTRTTKPRSSTSSTS